MITEAKLTRRYRDELAEVYLKLKKLPAEEVQKAPAVAETTAQVDLLWQLLISEGMTTHPIPNYPTTRVEACCQSKVCCGMRDGNRHFGSRQQP